MLYVDVIDINVFNSYYLDRT